MNDAPDSPSLVDHLAWTIQTGYAHESFGSLVERIPATQRGWVPPGTAHSAWQIVEHVRICQRDLIDYTTAPGHESPPFPDGLWPVEPAPPTEDAWDASVEAIERDRDALIALVRSYRTAERLTEPLPHIAPKTALRQVLIAIDHMSYHLGQLSLIAAMAPED